MVDQIPPIPPILPREPQEFSWLIQSLNAQGKIPMIVAGQAVNAWAKLFLPWDKNHNKSIKPNLQYLLPFTSKDLEVMDGFFGAAIKKPLSKILMETPPV